MPQAPFQPYVPGEPVAVGIHGQGHHPGGAVRADLRRVHRVPGAAGGPDRQRLDPDRGAGDLGAEEIRGLDGTLFSSGLIAGGSLAGILYAILFGRRIIEAGDETLGRIPMLHEGTIGMVAGGLLFAALGVILARAGQRKLTA